MLNVFLPALAFSLLAVAPVDRSFLAVPLTAGIVTLASLGAVFLCYRSVPALRAVPGPAFGVLVLSAAFGNVTYLGLPVITEMLGPRFGYVAVLYDLLATTPVLLTLGVFLAARSGSGRSVSLGASVRRVLRLPPLWGVLAGIAVNAAGIPVPAMVLDAASVMGRAVIPIMIFTVGLALDFRDIGRLPVMLPALAIKLLLSPVLACFIGTRLGLTGQQLAALTIEAAMPVMVLSLVIADELELDVPLAAASIAVSTVMLFFTMPLMLKLL